jgi:membrane-associated phospholipid phosphatase
VKQIFLLTPFFALSALANPTKHPADWKTWVITSAQEHGVAAPPDAAATREEQKWVRAALSEMNPHIVEQIRYWDAGPPSYRWMELIANRQIEGKPLGAFPVRASTYVALAMHDATLAAWSAKRQYRRPRPSESDTTIRPRVALPAGSSYPSDFAASAMAAATVLSYLVPAEATYFQQLAEEAGRSRLYAGVEDPTDYFAGLELGKRVAEQVIAKARADGADLPVSPSIPTGPCRWAGTNPGNFSASMWKPLLLTSPSEFRPAPPPPCDSAEAQAELAEVKNFPRALNGPNMSTNAKAFYWQTPEGVFPFAFLHMNRWVLEDKLDAPQAARAYALLAAVGFDAFISSQDGKFTYWYLRPAQLDPSLVPLFPAPNFPAYPSNHSTFSTARTEVMAYLFPHHADSIRALGKEAGDSRIWAGIHFPMDNRAGVQLGQKVARKFIEWGEKQ